MSKYYSYIFYTSRNIRPCTILGYTLTTFPKSRKTLLHYQSNRNLWHNCKRNSKPTQQQLHRIVSSRTLQTWFIFNLDELCQYLSKKPYISRSIRGVFAKSTWYVHGAYMVCAWYFKFLQLSQKVL